VRKVVDSRAPRQFLAESTRSGWLREPNRLLPQRAHYAPCQLRDPRRRATAPLVLTPVPDILSSAFVERASEQLPWFAVVLLVAVLTTSLVSRERRRRLGLTRFLLGYLCIAVVPLFGVIVLRSALREGLEQAGHGWWAALWFSLFWMVTFIVVAQWVLRRVPPTRGWLRDYRQAGRDIWRDRLSRWLGIRSRDG
jgi:hypothetical protein